MDIPEATTRRKRKPVSVIEATSAVPMPIVEVPAAEYAPVPPVFTDTVAASETATPPAAVPAEPQKDHAMDTETVTATTDQATAQATQMFGDVNARAKGAMEKGAQMVEELSAFNKGNLEAMVESSKIAARGLESLGQDAAAYAKTAFEQQTAAWRTLSGVKSPTEFLKVQGDLVRQSFDQLVAQGSRQTETMLKLAGEVAQPLSNRFAVAAEKIKVAA